MLNHPPDCQELACGCGAVLISEEREQAEMLQAEEISRKWYYSTGKQRYGPVPWNRIKTFVGRQKLGPDDLLWSRGMEQWKKVRQFPELIPCFPEGQRPSPPDGEDTAPAGADTLTFPTGEARPGEPDPAPAGIGGDPQHRIRPQTFLIQVSAGLLASLGFALIFGIVAVIYALLTEDIGTYLATWLIAAFLAGAVLLLGASQMVRLLCACLQDIRKLREQVSDSAETAEGDE